MKKFIIALLATACVTLASTNVTLWAPASISNNTFTLEIPSNQVAKVLCVGGTQASATIRSSNEFGTYLISLSTNDFMARNPCIAGPATVELNSSVSGAHYCTVNLSANEEVYQTPSGSVVIPADSAGDCEIILESSVDMVTWTAALPGVYGSSTEKRFFRVRAVHL